MIIVRTAITRIFLKKGFTAVCIWPFVFIRPGTDISVRKDLLNHERIHARQQLEMLWVFFFILYLIEYLVKLIRYRDHHKAYSSLAHEKEAYANDSDPGYLHKRKPYSWLKYL